MLPLLLGAGALAGGSYLANNMFKDPSKGAMAPLNQIPGTITPYYKPYVEAGANAIPGYQDVMQQLMNNPQEFINKLGQGYQASPGYDWTKKQGEAAISNANAAGGMAGSPQHEQQNAEMVTGLASKDFNDYMQRIMQGLGLGTQGTAGLIQQGATSSSDLATNLAQVLAAKSGLQYAGQANQNQSKGGLIGAILGLLGGK